MAMKLKFYLLGILFFTFVSTAAAQIQTPDPVPDEAIEVIDMTVESKGFDGTVYVLGNKYYLASSMESFFAKLNIDPKKDIYNGVMVSASNPSNKDQIEPVLKQLPEKYRNITNVFILDLKQETDPGAGHEP
jgi:hypothetical protein